MSDARITTRQATLADAQAIQHLINLNAKEGRMLPRALSEIYEHIRDFTVCEAEGRVVGCAALAIAWADLGEVRSLAVDPAYQRRGLGTLLVEACHAEARRMGLSRLFTLTYLPDFFSRLGYTVVDKKELPHKIWSDCIRCPHFPDCDEVALVRQVDLAGR